MAQRSRGNSRRGRDRGQRNHYRPQPPYDGEDEDFAVERVTGMRRNNGQVSEQT